MAHEQTSETHGQRMASESTQCFYEILGITRDATADEIGKAYKRAALRLHPDRHSHATETEKAAAAEKFKAVANAHSVLSDADKRDRYDRFGHAGLDGASANDAASQEMFEAMFGMNGGTKRARGVVGGAMFVDPERGHFFQRRHVDADALRAEMAYGLPAEASISDEGATYIATCARLPAGSWEVRLVDSDPEARTLSVTLVAAETGSGEGVEVLKSLSVCRTFSLPADADVAASGVDVTHNEATATLTVTVPKVGIETADVAPMETDDAPRADAGAVDADAHSPQRPEAKAARTEREGAPRSKRQQRGGKTLRRGFLNTPKPRRVCFDQLPSSNGQHHVQAAAKAALFEADGTAKENNEKINV